MKVLLWILLFISLSVVAVNFRNEIAQFFQLSISSHEPATNSDAEPDSGAQHVAEPPKVVTTKVYRWVDDEGKVHFGDRPTESNGVRVEEVVVSPENVTEWKETPKIIRPYVSQQVQSSSTGSDRRATCTSKRKRLDRMERSVRRHGGSSGEDPRIKDARWDILKNC